MQTQDFIVVQRNPAYIHYLSSFNPKLEAPLIQGFQAKPSSNTIELWFQSNFLNFWLQAPFTLLKRYPTLEQPLKWYPTFENLPLKDIQIIDLTKS